MTKRPPKEEPSILDEAWQPVEDAPTDGSILMFLMFGGEEVNEQGDYHYYWRSFGCRVPSVNKEGGDWCVAGWDWDAGGFCNITIGEEYAVPQGFDAWEDCDPDIMQIVGWQYPHRIFKGDGSAQEATTVVALKGKGARAGLNKIALRNLVGGLRELCDRACKEMDGDDD